MPELTHRFCLFNLVILWVAYWYFVMNLTYRMTEFEYYFLFKSTEGRLFNSSNIVGHASLKKVLQGSLRVQIQHGRIIVQFV